MAQGRTFEDLFTVKKPSDYLPPESYSNRSKSPHRNNNLNNNNEDGEEGNKDKDIEAKKEEKDPEEKKRNA